MEAKFKPSQQQLNDMAERSHNMRQSQAGKLTEDDMLQLENRPWNELSTGAKDFVRASIRTTIQAIEEQRLQIVATSSAGG